MSMLTPPGMGGKYRITGDKYPRMRRPSGRRRIVLAAIAALAVVGLLGWGSLQLIDVFSGKDEASAASGTKDCVTDTPRQQQNQQQQNQNQNQNQKQNQKQNQNQQNQNPLPKPAQIKVNVFNATPRGGLAKDTADELRKRGFAIGKVGNATKAYDKKVEGPGIVLGAKSATDTALPVLATQLTGAQRQTDTRKGGEVDLILGSRFKDLAKKEDADKALAALAKPSSTPSKPSADGKNC
ncbi:LytR C-terminal domain-containing protein [Streptomyces aureocirculatus]|uniref:LytR C-terminal domain-containing protein n=1 Tax=Streptomyces aureocirculatus TaxID=67275 RepID=UPI0007C45F73|nr:LytR C-terminal domain-containing protein [Streptomyces aureocirculatus]